MNLPTSSTIGEKSFIEGSLKSFHAQLSDAKTPISKELIVNYVMRYFVAFILPETINQNLSKDEIETIYAQCEKLLSIPRQFRSEYENEIPQRVLYACMLSQYALTMLFDIAQTAGLVEAIISTNLERKDEEPYYGLDLGTGSGILLSAQDICRRRNGFKKSENIGIDSCRDHVIRATQVLLELESGRVVIDDLTQRETYENLPKRKIHQISAELIGQPGMDVSMPEDPFHITMHQVFSILGEHIGDHTHFFPTQFHMRVSEFGEEKAVLVGNRENRFFAPLILEIEKRKKEKKEVGLLANVDPNTPAEDIVIECDKITIGGVVTPLEDIGKAYYMSGLVTQDLDKKPRRWVNQKKTLVEIMQGNDEEFQAGIIDLILETFINNTFALHVYFEIPESIELIEGLRKEPTNVGKRLRVGTMFLKNKKLKKDITICIKKIPISSFRGNGN